VIIQQGRLQERREVEDDSMTFIEEPVARQVAAVTRAVLSTHSWLIKLLEDRQWKPWQHLKAAMILLRKKRVSRASKNVFISTYSRLSLPSAPLLFPSLHHRGCHPRAYVPRWPKHHRNPSMLVRKEPEVQTISPIGRRPYTHQQRRN
jgi:hypothetical protein